MAWTLQDSIDTTLQQMVEAADLELQGKASTEATNRALAGLAWLLVRQMKEQGERSYHRAA